MKKLLVSIILLFFALNAFSQNNFNQIDKKGYKQGKWKKLYRSGQTYYEGEFKDNYEIGEFLYYYSDGTLKTRNTFSDQGRKCISEGFFESGKLMYKGIYLNKQKDSIWTYFQERTGKVLMEQRYAKGEKNGMWYIFDDRGDTIESTTYVNDEKNGPWFKIYEFGYIKGNYKNSHLDGKYENFYFDGKIKESGYYRDGDRMGEWDFYENNGMITKTEIWREGEIKDRLIYVKEGNKLIPISIFDIAYLYAQGNSNTVIVTRENHKDVLNKDFDVVQSLIGEDLFLLLNQKQKMAVQYNAIKNAEYDRNGEVISVIIEPTPDFPFSIDDNGKKAVKGFFLPELEE